MTQPIDSATPHQRLRNIAFVFPQATTEERVWFTHLAQLLEGIPGCATAPDRITLTPIEPPGALPVTSLELEDVHRPLVRFGMEQRVAISVGDLPLRSIAVEDDPPPSHVRQREVRLLEDEVGQYIHVVSGGGDFVNLLPIDMLLKRLQGHLVRVDHTGVNLLTTQLDTQAWHAFLHDLAVSAAIYRYPTGEEWPFILPTTDEEFSSEISRFVAGRAPKFELVYDQFLREPMIQIDLETDLTRAEIEARFPTPYGLALPGLEDFFRSVYVFHPWTTFTLRIDLRYLSDGSPSDWNTGEWLVREGGRLEL